jgi:hypothetical protein
MAIENATLTDTQQDILTVPAGKSYAITNILVCNTYSPNGASPEAQSANFDMHFLKDNQPLANAQTTVVRELELPAGETFTFDSEKIILAEGEKLSFVGDATNAANLSVSVSYLEV